MTAQPALAKFGLSLGLLILGSAGITSVLGSEALFQADFDSPDSGSFVSELLSNRHVSFAGTDGPDGSGAVRVEYEGYERGSRRVLSGSPLEERVREATLSYDVRFCEDFRFARGGKLHGLGPVKPVTGGNPVEPDRWSARVVFRSGGKLGAYVYAQDMDQKYGLSLSGRSIPIEPGEYHAVSLFVKLNEVGSANGAVELYVNGERIISDSTIKYLSSRSDRALISSFMFNTFHGGSSPKWAPKTDDGQYATECAYFDNISVHEGRRIRSRPE